MDPSEQQHDVTGAGQMTHPYETAADYQRAQEFQHQKLEQQLQMFWANQMQEAEQATDFKNHSLPLARIKKIMKADEDVRMISAEAPVIFAKACEMFILELTMRSWNHTEENKRRTLQKNDIAAAISKTDVFDFLVDILPKDEIKEDGLGVTKTTFPYYYPQPQPHPHVVGPSGMTMGTPADQTAYYPPQQPLPQMSFMPWTEDHAPPQQDDKEE